MKNNILFNNKQKLAYSVLTSGRNVFLTGGAGTGKSFVIQKYIEYCNDNNIDVAITAPTGIAALNIDGVTIHRAFKAPLGPIIEPIKSVASILKDIRVLIIDEISMCRIDLFEFVIKQVIHANKFRRAHYIDDIQLVVVGDFFQLPPVMRDEERDILEHYYNRRLTHGFAFESKLWNACGFVNIILDEVIRQTDSEFIDNLNKIRIGNKFGLRYFDEKSLNTEIKDAILLSGTNNAVKQRNEQELDKLKAKLVKYNANITGDVKESDKLTDDELKLKVGARVMTVINDQLDRFRNGSFGTVEKLSKNEITVKMDSGDTVKIERYKWVIKGYSTSNGKLKVGEVGTFEQFPLKLAYAITIHKSQGQTYDKVNLNPYCWDCGQLYVALSRVKSIDGLGLIQPIQPRYLVTSDEVKNFYNSQLNY